MRMLDQIDDRESKLTDWEKIMRYDVLLRGLMNKLARQEMAIAETREHIAAIEKLHAQDQALKLEVPAQVPAPQEKTTKK